MAFWADLPVCLSVEPARLDSIELAAPRCVTKLARAASNRATRFTCRAIELRRRRRIFAAARLATNGPAVLIAAPSF